MQEGQSTHDSDGESLTDTDPEAQRILDECRTRRRMEVDVGSSTRTTLEAQLNWLVKFVMDSYNLVAQAMRQSHHEGFSVIRAKLDSIYDAIVKATPESVAM